MLVKELVVCFCVAVILFMAVVADPINPISEVTGLKHPPPLLFWVLLPEGVLVAVLETPVDEAALLFVDGLDTVVLDNC